MTLDRRAPNSPSHGPPRPGLSHAFHVSEVARTFDVSVRVECAVGVCFRSEASIQPFTNEEIQQQSYWYVICKESFVRKPECVECPAKVGREDP